MGALARRSRSIRRREWRCSSPLLADPVRTVRIEAARALVSVPKEPMISSERAAFDRRRSPSTSKSQRVDADRAEAHVNLAAVVGAGETGGRRGGVPDALRMPALGAAYVNLADLYRVEGRDVEAEKVLRQGVAAAPRDPGVHHALGLALVRLKRMPEALRELASPRSFRRSDPRYVYVYGVALDSVGQTDERSRFWRPPDAGTPAIARFSQALASFSAKAGNRPAAIGYAKQLLELEPGNPEVQRLLVDLTAAQFPARR